jgi:hypothetical protein
MLMPEGLPPPRDLDAATRPLQPGPWCASVQLWGNPYLPGLLPGAHAHLLHTLGTITTLGDALRALAASRTQQQWQGPGGAAAWLPPLRTPPWLRDRHAFRQALLQVVGSLPAGWVPAAQAALAAAAAAAGAPAAGGLGGSGGAGGNQGGAGAGAGVGGGAGAGVGAMAPLAAAAAAAPAPAAPIPPAIEVEAMLVERLGWQLPDSNTVADVACLTVKAATLLQLGPVLAERAARHKVLANDALMADGGGAGGLVAQQVVRTAPERVQLAQRHLWKLRWDNGFKEVYWRLVLDGLPTYRRMGATGAACICVCGASNPGRAHHFWQCTVAQAVVAAVQGKLPSPPAALAPPGAHGGVPPLQCQHLWLMRLPPALVQVHRGVWRVVCLAAINAMEEGRRKLYGVQLAAARGEGGPLVGLPVGQQLAAVRRFAVACFWELLADFVAMQAAPEQWVAQLGPSHPFLGVDSSHARLVVQGP